MSTIIKILIMLTIFYFTTNYPALSKKNIRLKNVTKFLFTITIINKQ